MKVAAENYRGIEFVRISSLPENQKNLFWQSFNKSKIIKILKGDSLLNDCIQYIDYTDWLATNFKQEMIATKPSVASTEQILKVA
jgi:hypothetical protein